jgi:LacI family transcriptional regulator
VSRKVTIQDVARAAGTSVSTVSRVLTGSAPVSEEKRRAIEEAIERLGYRPNSIARSLKTKTTYSIGLLINDISNPFYSSVAKGVEEEANRHGYSLILCNVSEDARRELQYLQVLVDKQVDGIIFGPTGQNTAYIRDLANRTPLVQVDRRLEDVDATAVLVDNEGGAYRAVRLLIEKGHERIGLLAWGTSITTSFQRIAGYERAIQEANLPLDPSIMIKAPHIVLDQTYDLARQLLAQTPRPTAVFALNNQLGLAALRVIREAGLRVPEDVALIVFDDLEIFALMSPSIAAVDQPAFLIGQRAMQFLMEHIENPKGKLPETIILPTRLIVRESV